VYTEEHHTSFANKQQRNFNHFIRTLKLSNQHQQQVCTQLLICCKNDNQVSKYNNTFIHIHMNTQTNPNKELVMTTNVVEVNSGYEAINIASGSTISKSCKKQVTTTYIVEASLDKVGVYERRTT
jgi:hypothetical protein